MSNKTSVIATIAVLLFAVESGAVSAASISTANVSTAVVHSSNNSAMMLAYGASETDAKSKQGHSGKEDHGKCGNMMSKIDSDEDGKISKEEFIKYHEEKFKKKDLNNDGFIDEDEMQKMMEKYKHKHDYHGKKEMGDKVHGHGDMKE